MTAEYFLKAQEQNINEITDMFSKIKIQKSGIRKNINNGKRPESMILGYRKWFVTQEFGLSVGTSKNPVLYEKLKELIASFDPEFVFSTITLNRNFLCQPHKDKGNVGDSYIIGFGDYSGGELNIEGVKHDIKYKFLKFDGGKKTHWVEPFEGNRYTAVFYKHKDYQA